MVISMIRSYLTLVKNKLSLYPVLEFKRNQYKEDWNFRSRSEEKAKIAIALIEDEKLFRQSAQTTLDMLQSCVGIRKDDVVLEIGAGVGRVGAYVAPLCRKWIGTDVSENMIKYLRRRLSEFPNVEAIATNGFDLAPIPSESVDVAYCTIVFMHLDEWDRYGYIAEGFRILKPGGRMLVDNVNLLSDGGWKFFEEHRAMTPNTRAPSISKISTPQELETYMRRAGFGDIRHQDNSNFWIVTYGTKPRAPINKSNDDS